MGEKEMRLWPGLFVVTLAALGVWTLYHTYRVDQESDGASGLDKAENHVAYSVDELKQIPDDAKGITLCGLGDSALRELQRFSSLEYLYIPSGVAITDAGVLHLEKIHSLRQLVLPNCRALTDKSASSIGKLINLECLDVRDIRYTDKAVEELVKLERLTELRIDGHIITKQGLSTLLSMKSLQRVAVVKARNCEIGNIEALAKRTDMQAITIHGIPVPIDDLLVLLSKSPRLTHLDLKSDVEATRAASGHISNFQKLVSLSLCWTGDVRPWLVEYIGAQTTLTSLTLKGQVKDFDNAKTAFRRLALLEEITTIGIEVDDEWMKVMSGIETLAFVAVSGSAALTKRAIQDFVRIRHPCTVRIHDCLQISQEDCQDIASSLSDSSIEWTKVDFDE